MVGEQYNQEPSKVEFIVRVGNLGWSLFRSRFWIALR